MDTRIPSVTLWHHWSTYSRGYVTVTCLHSISHCYNGNHGAPGTNTGLRLPWWWWWWWWWDAFKVTGPSNAGNILRITTLHKLRPSWPWLLVPGLKTAVENCLCKIFPQPQHPLTQVSHPAKMYINFQVWHPVRTKPVATFSSIGLGNYRDVGTPLSHCECHFLLKWCPSSPPSCSNHSLTVYHTTVGSV